MERAMLEELVGQFALEKSLTKREREILFLLTKNVTHLKEIAAHLSLSRSTINNHLNNIYIKASVKGKAQLLAQCFGYVSQKIADIKTPSNRPKVLLIDEKENTRLILKDHLAEMGLDVITTTSLSQIRALLEKEKFDLIFSDINMPEVEGFRVIKEVRVRQPRYPLFTYDRLYKMTK